MLITICVVDAHAYLADYLSHKLSLIFFNMPPFLFGFVNSGFPSTRINLSPFTKDFRGGEQLNESID